MSIDLGNLATWFSERPKWLQDAARRLFQAGELTGADRAELVILCKREAGINVPEFPALVAAPISAQALSVAETSSSLRLNAIADVKGINALSPRNPLELGAETFTIVYGSNGSGKSGYIRILKHICGGKGTKPLQGNVFETPHAEKSCRVRYTLGTDKREFLWTPDLGVHAELRGVSLYDNDCALVYVNNENEVAYEPTLLANFRKLVEACQALDNILAEDIAKKVSAKPLLPPDYALTVCGKWFSNLTRATAGSAVDAHCSWNDEFERELITLNQRVSEAHPADKAKALRKTRGHLAELRALLTTLGTQLSDEAFSRLGNCRQTAATKRRAAHDDARRVFENAPLTGVASESWALLWEKARAYSELEAYNGLTFPFVGDGARCVLCHQPLADDAKERMSAFEAYVKGTLEADAKLAEDALSSLVDSIKEVPSADDLSQKLDLAEIAQAEERERIHDYAAQLRTRHDSFLRAADPTDLAPMPANNVLTELQESESRLEKVAAAFDEDAKADRKIELQNKVRELNARKWLSQQKPAVVAEIARLQEVHLLEQAKRLASTKALSEKKTSLAEALITAAFTKRFEDELRALGASRLQVTIQKTRTIKAQVWHQITLKNTKVPAKTADVLSEGELRVVSLAAFLADVAMNKVCTPFIFDDPISSLDQDYEEATAGRLAELSKNCQVIVFTHRLSLLFMLEEAAKKKGVGVKIISLERQSWGPGEPCAPPLPAQKPKQAVNALANERLAKARKVWQNEGNPAYAVESKALCSDIRITIERLIECELLAEVVQRFRRPIQTQNKIEKLANIRLEDCQFFDAMMTKYSRYEHSQPNEAPVSLPEPDELAADLKQLADWLAEFSGRLPVGWGTQGPKTPSQAPRQPQQPNTGKLLSPDPAPKR